MPRKMFVGVCALAAAVVGAFSAGRPIASAAEVRRPNIILLLTDDQRWDALGCQGNSILQTPHLDALARRGALFTNSFCTTSICATSRATILTGQHARRHGVWDFTTSLSSEAWENTFPAQLRRHGYRLGFIGKWGVGDVMPEKEYDYWAGFPGQGRYYPKGAEDRAEHLTRRQGRKAMEFLSQCSPEQPFCLQISFKAPHCQDGETPRYPHDRRHNELYAGQDIPAPATASEEHHRRLPEFLQSSEGRVRWKLEFDGEPMRQETVRSYYRLITGVDEVVGQIVDKLQKMGAADNTVIVYTSDNGFFLGDYGLSGKWFAHDASMRTPLIVFDPRRPAEERGRKVDSLALSIDIAPTILDAAGIEPPPAMQGRSLLPALSGAPEEWPTEFYYEHRFEHPLIPKSEAVRTQEWKYVRYISATPNYEELFQLTSDPLEERNLAGEAKYQTVLVEMRKKTAALAEAAAKTPHDGGKAASGDATGGKPRQRLAKGKLEYPETAKGDQVDDYHGTRIADPYRWLEDPDSPETEAWVEAQNKVTFAYLEQLPQREKIKQRLTELWNFERFGLPVQKGGKYFYEYNNGLQNQNMLLVVDSPGAEPRLLLDPNKFAADGTIALDAWLPSDDGSLLAYGTSSGGSDWKQWKFLDVASGKELPDQIQWVKFSGISWTPDNRGVFYSRYDEPKAGEELTAANYYHKLYFHRLGEQQSQDTLVYERKDEKEWGFGGEVTEDGDYLVVSVWRGTEEKNQIFYRDLRKADSPVVELVAGFDAAYTFLGNDGPVFWLLTDLDAPLKRIVAVDTSKPDRSEWKELVPQGEHVIEDVGVVADRFFVSYLKDASTLVKEFDLTGAPLREVSLPALGTVTGFGGQRKDQETFYSFTNFSTPPTIYRYLPASGESSVFRQPKVGFDPADYVTEQVFYNSADGTRVPMFISYKKGLNRSAPAPTVLYAYGGFNISLAPAFSVPNLVWMEAGGVYAQPNLRGGGEYGREWHEAGMKDRKQNVFNDFIAAAEYLIANGYTSPDKLAVRGGSNGGLLVGAVMTQRPELFAVALPAVGVMDMLRYHKFTIGWAWVSEFGSADDPQEFSTLIKYSPLHNIKPGVKYPATLVTTADHDDRVVPAHSHKFAATLQAAQGGDAPVLIRIDVRAGHGAGKPTTKRIEEAADIWAFTADILGLEF